MPPLDDPGPAPAFLREILRDGALGFSYRGGVRTLLGAPVTGPVVGSASGIAWPALEAGGAEWPRPADVAALRPAISAVRVAGVPSPAIAAGPVPPPHVPVSAAAPPRTHASESASAWTPECRQVTP